MKRKILALLLILTLVFTFSGCKQDKDEIKDVNLITEKIIEKFAEMTEIPRTSFHEKEISDFLKNWAENLGYEVVQDEVNNIIVEVPATEGMEDKSLVVLQGHMDMVFAQKDGLNLDPKTTKITMVNDGTYIRSDNNTSLGADDGIGVAIMRLVAEGEMAHGPLRLIITTDEERSSTGVNNIDPMFVQDAKYMINLDDEIEGEIVISSASGNLGVFSGNNDSLKPNGDMGVEVMLKGLTGGHSGDEIDKDRLNGIIAMGDILDSLRKNGINYQISSFNGGNAPNAIPTGATVTLSISQHDFENLKTCINESIELLKNYYSETDPDIMVEIKECENPTSVISDGNLNNIIKLTQNIINGVNSMSDIIEGLVESSSNLGIIDVDTEKTSISAMLRSSSAEKEKEITESFKELAKECNFELEVEDMSMPWPAKENNELQRIAEESYKDLFGKELEVLAIHAGLECGTFSTYNEDLNIIAMGPTVTDPHSINEKVEIDTIGKVWVLLEDILKRIE